MTTETGPPARESPLMHIAAKDRLIVALDQQDEAAVMPLIEALGDEVTFYKVGYLRVFNRGLGIVEELLDLGKRVFLDLKFFDVPQTVAGNIRRAADMGVFCATVHGNGNNIAAARKAVDDSGNDLRVLAVTMLTSLSRADVSDLYGVDQPVEETVMTMAQYLVDRGCDGVIASPQEAKRLRDELKPRVLIVTPGVRLADDSTDDHQRQGSPGQAIVDGADYLVVGRPIYNSPDPVEAAARYVRNIQEGLGARVP